MATKRKICWPHPDATCLEGGCGYCNYGPYRAISTIRRYAENAGTLKNRAVGEKSAMEAFRYGEAHEWNNAESK